MRVGGGDVGVAADHQRGAAVAEVAHGLLLRGRLGVHVHDHRVRALAQGAGGELALGRCEGAVEGVHEQPPHDQHHEHAPAVGRLVQIGAPPRRARAEGVVRGPEEPRLALDVGQGLALVPGVVAERDAVDARAVDLLGGRLGDAEAAGRVLAVGHDEVEREPLAQLGQPSREPFAARAAHHVAEESQAHAFDPCVAALS